MPINNTSRYLAACNKMREANAADTGGKADVAYKLFTEAASLFLEISKATRDKNADAYKFCEVCIKRAEELRAHGSPAAPTLPAAAAAPAAAAGARAVEPLAIQTPVLWDDIIGVDDARQVLTEAVMLPVIAPHQFCGIRQPWRALLLFGPPGTGKTQIAMAAATQMKAAFYELRVSDIVSKWVGESEQNLDALFKKARATLPAIIFIDEIDSLCSSRAGGENSESAARLKTMFLTLMSGIGVGDDGLVVLAATNLPWVLDDAIVRRFERRILVDMPSREAREQIVRRMVHNTPHSLQESDFQRIAANTDGFSGADLRVVMKRAGMASLDQLMAQVAAGAELADLDVVPIRMEDVEKALRQTPRSVRDESVRQNREWATRFGEHA